jgi:uncharacterized damage-inducible protein DinB
MPTAPPNETGEPKPQPQADAPVRASLQRDPEHWKTGDEPMTAAQASYLRTLAEEAGEPFDAQLTKAEAAERIDALRARVGRVARGEHPAAASSGLKKDPAEWKTGDEPMTAAQASYLQTLAEEAGVKTEGDLTKAEAAQRIEALQKKTGRGKE